MFNVARNARCHGVLSVRSATTREEDAMAEHAIGTREQWLAARLELLDAEKEHTRRSDELARRRQELPWVRIEKEYSFETDVGSASLPDLFQGRVGTDWATYTREAPGISAF